MPSQQRTVTDVHIQTSSSCPAGMKSPEKFDGLNGDLNQGAGGKDIFMCYKTAGSTSGWEAGEHARRRRQRRGTSSADAQQCAPRVYSLHSSARCAACILPIWMV